MISFAKNHYLFIYMCLKQDLYNTGLSYIAQHNNLLFHFLIIYHVTLHYISNTHIYRTNLFRVI